MQLVFTGAKGSGKSTMAQHFIDEHNASHVYFAHGIDRELNEMLGIDWDTLRGKPTPSWLRRLKQFWGTELRRDMPPPVGYKDYWVDQWLSAVRARLTIDKDILVVCDDMRYPNEHEAASSLTGTLFIRCEPNPDIVLDESDQHTSEQYWATMGADIHVPWQPIEQRVSWLETALLAVGWTDVVNPNHLLT